MTTRDKEAPLAEAAAQVLAADEPTDLPRTLEGRAAQIAAIDQALRGRARRRSIRRPMLAAGLVATAVAAAALVAWLGPRPRVSELDSLAHRSDSPRGRPAMATVESARAAVTVAGVTRDLAAGDEIALGTPLGVPRGGDLSLRLVTGTRVGLAGGTSLLVADLGLLSRFDLQEGRITADVVKLAPGHRFIVTTPDAEVEVRGTRFEVEVSPDPSRCGQSARTGVVVHEGVVTVRFGASEVRVSAGHHWPDCAGAAMVAPPHVAVPPDRPHARRRAARAPAAVAADVDEEEAAPAATSSTLAEQNDLLAAALAAERRGDVEQAERWLDRLLQRYPTGQLAGSARAERLRLNNLSGGKASVP